jgi:hypothetical protein
MVPREQQLDMGWSLLRDKERSHAQASSRRTRFPGPVPAFQKAPGPGFRTWAVLPRELQDPFPEIRDLPGQFPDLVLHWKPKLRRAPREQQLDWTGVRRS